MKTTDSRLVWDSTYPLTLHIVDELGNFVLTFIIQCFYNNSMVLAKVVTFEYMFYRYYNLDFLLISDLTCHGFPLLFVFC